MVNVWEPAPPKMLRPDTVEFAAKAVVDPRTAVLKYPVLPVTVKFCGSPLLRKLFRLPTTSGKSVLVLKPKTLLRQEEHVIGFGKPDWNVESPPIDQLPRT